MRPPACVIVSSVPEVNACRAVVVSCIDYRFFGWLGRFLRDEGLDGAADVITWPGGGLALTAHEGETVREAMRVSIRLHDPSQAVLVAHEDCGWLKEREGNPDMADLLRGSGRDVAARFPLETVRLVVIAMDGSTRSIE